MMKKYDVRNNKLIPFATICRATAGDVEAIQTILGHFEGYIATLATKCICDASGNSHFYVDEEIRRRLEIKLITKILSFKVA